MTDPSQIHSVAPETSSFFSRALNFLRGKWTYYLVMRADKVRYLRHLGVRIGEGCEILNRIEDFGSEPWLIELGKRNTLAYGVQLITHDGSSRLFRSELANHSKYGNRFGRILIHDECFIGVNAIILPGVEIGPRSIIGAASLVNQDVPPGCVYAGNPARCICSLDEYIEKYRQKMVPIQATNRPDLRRELTNYFWNEER
jgi:acetyltransferase-like isoleucine patch superfamily enzyme